MSANKATEIWQLVSMAVSSTDMPEEEELVGAAKGLNL